MYKNHEHKPHIIVVGAGILGASIAFHLTLRGTQVTIVDAAAPGQGATRISFAWLNAFGKDPFHYHDLNRRSMDMWPRFVRRLGVEEAITWGGELKWVTTEAEAEALIARVKTVQGWGYPTRLVDAAELKQLEPDLQIPQMQVAAYTDIEAHVDTQQVVRACMSAVGGGGAKICTQTPVTDLQLVTAGADGSVIEAVQIGGSTIPCDGVVFAGGADMPQLATMAGINLPVYHTFGATILTEPVAPLFKTVAVLNPFQDTRKRVNFRQFKDGTVMVQGGAVENKRIGNKETGDRGQTGEEIAQLMADAAAILPTLADVKIKAVQRGRRPLVQDGHPILGFSETVANLYIATTHSGVTLTPIIGEMATIEILDRVEVDLFAPYRPRRFA